MFTLAVMFIVMAAVISVGWDLMPQEDQKSDPRRDFK